MRYLFGWLLFACNLLLGKVALVLLSSHAGHWPAVSQFFILAAIEEVAKKTIVTSSVSLTKRPTGFLLFGVGETGLKMLTWNAVRPSGYISQADFQVLAILGSVFLFHVSSSLLYTINSTAIVLVAVVIVHTLLNTASAVLGGVDANAFKLCLPSLAAAAACMLIYLERKSSERRRLDH